jgi:hypothetical protein
MTKRDGIARLRPAGFGVAALAYFATIGSAGLPSRSLRSKRRLVPKGRHHANDLTYCQAISFCEQENYLRMFLPMPGMAVGSALTMHY